MRNREKFEKMTAEAMKKYFDDIHSYYVAEYLKKAEKYRKILKNHWTFVKNVLYC